MQTRYQNYRQNPEDGTLNPQEFAKTALFFNNPHPRGFNGNTWDATHMSSFLRRSNYSNWRGESPSITRNSQPSRTTQGDHFFKTTKEDKNQSKIGFTPIFPLVSNAPLVPAKQITLRTFFNSSELSKKEERVVSGRSLKLRCSPDDRFKFQANAIKYKQTDPLTMSNQLLPFESVNGFQKERMNRLIGSRHPHGITGVDHPQNPESKYYSVYQQKIKIREQPNSGRTHLIDRDWNQKKRSKPPVDEWKSRVPITIRKFRNQNIHGYNILTNRKLDQ